MTTPFSTLPTLAGYADTPDENPLSNGGKFVQLEGDGSLRRISGEIQPQAEGDLHHSIWIPQFYTDFAITWVLGDISGFELDLRVRASADGTTSYYEGHVDNGAPGVGNYELLKRVGGGSTSSLATDAAGPDPETFDRIGIAVIGTSLELWHQAHTGDVGDPDYGPTALSDDLSWTQVLTATDSDLASGYFVLGLGGLTAAVFQASGSGVFPGSGDTDTRSGSLAVDIRIAEPS